ncbi:MAG: oxygenase MpaB family protein [Acidimicrobiia bacterium]
MADLVTELALGDIPTRTDFGLDSRLPARVLASARRRGDPLGDHVVAEIARRHPIHETDDVLAEVRALAETEGGIFRELLESCCYVPPWADFAAMEPGLRLFAATGPVAAVSNLGRGTGAEPPSCAEGRFVIERDLTPRLAGTGASMFLVPLPGEVQPGGRHHTVVMRVRLMHAVIRRSLSADAAYDVERFGTPISQEDMAFAILLFAYLNVRGLRRLGVRVSDAQRASLGLVWRWIGHVLGVEDKLLCTDTVEQAELYRSSVTHHTGDGPAASGLPLATRAIRAAGSAYGWVLRLPGAEAVLHRVGSLLLETRYDTPTCARQ